MSACWSRAVVSILSRKHHVRRYTCAHLQARVAVDGGQHSSHPKRGSSSYLPSSADATDSSISGNQFLALQISA